MASWSITCSGDTPPRPLGATLLASYLDRSCLVLGENDPLVREYGASHRAVQELTDLASEVRRIYDEAHDRLLATEGFGDPTDPYPNVNFYWEQIYSWSFQYDHREEG